MYIFSSPAENGKCMLVLIFKVGQSTMKQPQQESINKLLHWFIRMGVCIDERLFLTHGRERARVPLNENLFLILFLNHWHTCSGSWIIHLHKAHKSCWLFLCLCFKAEVEIFTKPHLGEIQSGAGAQVNTYETQKYAKKIEYLCWRAGCRACPPRESYEQCTWRWCSPGWRSH